MKRIMASLTIGACLLLTSAGAVFASTEGQGQPVNDGCRFGTCSSVNT